MVISVAIEFDIVKLTLSKISLSVTVIDFSAAGLVNMTRSNPKGPIALTQGPN